MTAKANTRQRTQWQTDQVRTEIARRYVDHGQSVREIARDLGCGYGTVHKVLTEANVQLRPRGGGHRQPRPPHPGDRSSADRT